MMASTGERLAMRRRATDSSWQRPGQPLTSHALCDCKLVEMRFLICKRRPTISVWLAGSLRDCRDCPYRATAGHIGRLALCLQPNP